MKEKNNIFKQIDMMISVIALIVLICITFIGVVFRYVLGTPFSWLEEVQLALIIWIVFCGGRYAFETNSHVAIDMIYDMFPNKGKKVLLMIIAVVVTVVLAFVCFYSIDYIKIMFQYSISTSILSVPCGILYIPIPVSCILMMIQFWINTKQELEVLNNNIDKKMDKNTNKNIKEEV